jgi:hypothetical protein
MNKQKDVFISHSSMEKAIAEELCNYFESNGLSCWIAPRDVRAGKAYASEIVTGIENSGLFFLLLTENANKSEQVTNEVDRAVNKHKTIIPFRLGDFVLNKDLEFYLSKSHWIVGGARPDKLYSQLLTQIQLSLGIKEEKEDPSTFKAVFQAVSPQKITVVIKNEVVDIPNSLAYLKELLEEHAIRFFAFNNHVYNIRHISEGAFNMLTGKTAFNEYLTKRLVGEIKSMCPAAERFSEKAFHIENWEADPKISDSAKAIIAYSFAGIVGKELSQLMAIGKEPFSGTKMNKYVMKCTHIVKLTLDLVTFALLSELWDIAQKKAVEYSDSERKLLFQRFDTPFEPDITGQANLLLALINICYREQHNGDLPLTELLALVELPEKKDELQQICLNFQKLQSDRYDIQDCFVAEHNLTEFMGSFRFLTMYQMASVKVIGYRQIKNYRPGFVHRYIALGIDSKANVDAEKVEFNHDTTYSESVLIFKGNDFRKSVNLFPFAVDYNAINFEQGSNICFYRALPLDGKCLEFISLETGKSVIFEKSGLFDKKKDLSELLYDAENTKLLNRECVYDRFIEARRCILNEISFDDI